jgi:hypothetical protein
MLSLNRLAATVLKLRASLPITRAISLDVPLVSVIVPLSGDPVKALRCFEGIAAQAPAHEVIVVDDAPTGLRRSGQRLAPGGQDALRGGHER